MTSQERYDVVMALRMWANYIETHNPITNRNDAVNLGRKPISLTDEQQLRIMKLRDLADRIDNEANK